MKRQRHLPIALILNLRVLVVKVVIPDDADWEKEWDEWHEELWRKWRKVTPPELYRQKYTAESFTGNDEDEDWEPAPRVTEADHRNDTKSLERKLDRRLFLLVNSKGMPPQPPLTPCSE